MTNLSPSFYLQRTLWSRQPLHLQIKGTKIFRVDQSKGQTTREIFDLSQSAWVADFFSEHGFLTDPQCGLDGEISLTPPATMNHKGAGGPLCLLKATMAMRTRVTCVQCQEDFPLMVTLQEDLRIVEPPKETDQVNSQETDPLGWDHLDEYELRPQGLAIDEVVLDLCATALPEYPRCSNCAGALETEQN